MISYIIRRLLLVVPTLIAIVTINFFIIQVAPGGPVDQLIAKLQGMDSGVMEQVTGSKTELTQTNMKEKSTYRGAQGLDPEVIAEIERRFGFDKPIHVRYFKMLKDFICFDFGDSLFRGRSVIELIVERIPVSVSLGLWSTLIIHLVCIPLGIKKALKHSSRFDVWTSTVIIIGNAIPVFLFAILLIILFAGGTYFNWFPLRGLVSVNFDQLSLVGKILDYFWHMALPTLALVIGGFATLTFLTKNSFLDEISKQYVVTARAKGLTENRILYGHVFRNAMILVIASFPSAFIGLFFTGSMLIEVIFSLDGMGLLGFQATLQRDFPLMFSTLYIFTLMGLILSIISDITYTIVDPRIDFEKRG
ncbi:microcin C ABC transporter permease YejB [Desulfobacula toluolica]|uniref:ABC-type oligopeptide transporter, inner membrane component n=1 Tax=Desulfobacula toluolica (strain DSM 7467 / Tol2) TaxID=651182 RepID=K0NL79_DESTT|nr:microcin C ABC transporter permease YejB [Desulfobacula toluolica]CCK80738.1 ABC-type oligopeptide transporter, inner membrane component [Desulfobacula toluolica Tol2]